MMNFMKSFLTGALMDPYVCKPSPLKQQSLRCIALTLCHNSSIRRRIFDPELEIVADTSLEQVRLQWEKSLNAVLIKTVTTLFLPQVLQTQLISLIRSMGLQLLIWSGEWKDMYNIACNFTANFWLPTDFIENRLCEIKIAERIMDDDRLSTDQRYRVACMYCLEDFISSLWNELSPERRESYIHSDPDEAPDSDIISMWTRFLLKSERFQNKEYLYGMLNNRGIRECRAAAFIFAWYKFNVETHYEKVLHLAGTRYDFEKLRTLYCQKQVLPFTDSLSIELPESSERADVFSFFLMKVRDYKVSGYEAMLKYYEPIIKYFLEWPQEIFF